MVSWWCWWLADDEWWLKNWWSADGSGLPISGASQASTSSAAAWSARMSSNRVAQSISQDGTVELKGCCNGYLNMLGSIPGFCGMLVLIYKHLEGKKQLLNLGLLVATALSEFRNWYHLAWNCCSSLYPAVWWLCDTCYSWQQSHSAYIVEWSSKPVGYWCEYRDWGCIHLWSPYPCWGSRVRPRAARLCDQRVEKWYPIQLTKFYNWSVILGHLRF